MEDSTYKNFFNYAPYGVFIADEEGNYIEINEKGCQISGYAEDELIGSSIFATIIEEDIAQANMKFEELKKSTSAMVVLNYLHKNGDKRICKVIAFKINESRFIGFFEDITEQNNLESKVKYEEDKGAKYFETANVMFVVIDRQGLVQDINAKGCEILDYNRREIIGKNWINNFINESSRDKVQKVFDKVINKELSNVEFFENGIVTSKGEERLISWHNNVIKDGEDEVSLVISAGEDITERRNAEKALIESEEKHKYIFENSPVGKSLTKPSGELSVNQTFCKMLGYTKQELESKSWKDITHPDDIEKSDEVTRRLISGVAEAITFEKRYIRKDGSVLWASVSTALRKDASDQPVYFLTSIIDISPRKKAEKELIQSKEEFRILFEDAPLGYQSLDENGHFLFINRAWLEMMGYQKDEVIGECFGDYLANDQAENFQKIFAECKVKGSHQITLKLKTKTNDNIIANITAKSAYNSEGGFLQTHCIVENVTERLEYQKRLQQNEERLRRSQKIAKAGTWELEIGSDMIWASDANELFGVNTENDLISIEDMQSMIHEDDRQMVHNTLLDFIEGKSKYDIEYRIKPLQGKEFRYIRSVAEKQYDDQGNITKVIGVISDITDRKLADLALVESRAILQAAFENSQAGIAIADAPDGKLRFVNRAGLLIRNKSEEELVKNIDYHKYVSSWNILHLDGTPYKDEEVPLARAVLFGDTVSEEFIIRRDDFEDRIVLANAGPIRNSENKIVAAIMIFLDITIRKKLEQERVLLEEKVWNHQKLESIGTLASGVAHEINNPINGILNYGQIILDSTEHSSQINKMAQEIIYETNRVSGIVKSLLDFSRQSGKQHSYAQITDIVERTLSLINTVFKRDDIVIDIDIKQNISPLKCRSQQIQQVLMNLLTNARDSLNEKYPVYHENKKINLECHELYKDNRKWISISIKDFGTGIPEDVKHRIFDPFFTTKDKEKGTGLGLSISYGIIKEHHGEIKVETKEGEYSEFICVLPCDNGWDLDTE